MVRFAVEEVKTQVEEGQAVRNPPNINGRSDGQAKKNLGSPEEVKGDKQVASCEKEVKGEDGDKLC